MKTDYVVAIFKDIIRNKPYSDDISFDEEWDTFLDKGDRIEYQVRGASNDDFTSILMRYTDDDLTHTYIQIYPEEFGDDIYGLIYYALDEAPERLFNCWNKAVERERKKRLAG